MTFEKIPVTVIVAAKNEEKNLPKCLSALVQMERVIVVDSNSTDQSVDICQRMNAEVVQFNYQGGYPKKRQWAMDNLTITTPWVMLLDADEVVPQELLDETRAAIESEVTGFFIRKGFHFLGRKFRYGGFSFSALLLFRTGSARFEHLLDEASGAMDMEVHERLIVNGETRSLKTPLIHEDFKDLEAYLSRHNKYSTWEARVRQKLISQHSHSDSIRANLWGNVQERRRFLKLIAMKTPGEPWLWFFYHYLVRLGIFEGKAGFFACSIRSQYIANVRAKLYELRQHRRP